MLNYFEGFLVVVTVNDLGCTFCLAHCRLEVPAG